MKFPVPDSFRGQTILLVGGCLLFFQIASLVPYFIFSAGTVTLEREEQIADRIVAISHLINHAHFSERPYLVSEVSGSRFNVTVDAESRTDRRDESALNIIDLITTSLKPKDYNVKADYHYSWGTPDDGVEAREPHFAIQLFLKLFRSHEALLVSVNLPDGQWLNFRVSGSAWDHIIAISVIPSLILVALSSVLLAGWAIRKPLLSLSRFSRGSREMGLSIQDAQPIDETGPREFRDAAQAFNQMQSRVKQLLEARNLMLGAISHDLRSPMTRLRLRIEFIEDIEKRNQAICDLDEMEHLIKLTLAYTREEGGEEQSELMDIGKVMIEVIKDLEIAIDKISVDVQGNNKIFCQPYGIRRVLTNIIENGMFYGSQIEVVIQVQRNQVVVEVDDTGPGIDARYRNKVFTPFYRLESSRNRKTGGVGLGLSIAQTIVHKNRGTIELLDSPIGGLRVRLTFPKK